VRIKRLLSLGILFIFLTTFLFPSKLLATSWAYPFVVWDGYIYVVQDEYVTEIDREIGKVTRYSDMEQYAGNFSNAYKRGTKYYSIVGISTDEAIAIQDKEGKYKKAVRENEYMYAGGRFGFSGLIAGLFVLFLIITLGIYFVEKRVKK
jgi:hypothetical protein